MYLESIREFFQGCGDDFPLTYDPYDLWATKAGRSVRSIYYRFGNVSIPVVAPFVGAEVLCPSLIRRSFNIAKKSYPITNAQLLLVFYHLNSIQQTDFLPFTASEIIDNIMSSRVETEAGVGWGLPFPWKARTVHYPADTPFITHMTYVVEALVEAYQRGDFSNKSLLRRTGSMLKEGFPSGQAGSGGSWSGYSPRDERKVINAAAYRAYGLALLGRFLDEQEWVSESHDYVKYVSGQQRPDGSWPYSPEEQFVDHLHTGMVLKNLHKWRTLVDNPDINGTLERGVNFYTEELFDSKGSPKPFHEAPRIQLHTWDLYDAAEATYTLNRLSGGGFDLEPQAESVAHRTIRKYQTHEGSFVYRDYGFFRSKICYLRWGQVPFVLALSSLVSDMMTGD
ncbi:MAG: hypothetical protein ABEK50_18170 [bacterium]